MRLYSVHIVKDGEVLFMSTAVPGEELNEVLDSVTTNNGYEKKVFDIALNKYVEI